MTVVPLPDAKLMSFEAFLEWKPDGVLWELHRGTAIEMQPTGKHEEVIGFLQAELTIAIKQLQLPYFIPKQTLIKIPDEVTAYCPDVVLINRPLLTQEPLWNRASTIMQGTTVPLVIEVVSTNWRDDYGKKLVDYEALGIAEYWIADYLGLGGVRYISSPKQPTFSIYSLVDHEYQVQQFRGSDLIQSPLFPSLQLTAEQIFRAGA